MLDRFHHRQQGRRYPPPITDYPAKYGRSQSLSPSSSQAPRAIRARNVLSNGVRVPSPQLLGSPHQAQHQGTSSPSPDDHRMTQGQPLGDREPAASNLEHYARLSMPRVSLARPRS